MTFQRENRYIVIKRKDLKNVPVNYRTSLVDPMFQLLAHLPTRECLVIESDWPEYEPAWRMIQARVEGTTLSPAHIEDGEEVEVVGTLIIGEQGWDNAIELNPGPVMALADAHPKSAMLLMTVAQHQRIVAARASKAAARVEDEREVFERAVLSKAGRFQPDLRRVGDEYKDSTMQWAFDLWQARAALSAPPAAGVPIGMACKINGYWEAQLFASHGCIDRQSLYAHPLPSADVPTGLAHRLLKAYDYDDTGAMEAAIEDIRTMLAAAPTPPASEQQQTVPRHKFEGLVEEVRLKDAEIARLAEQVMNLQAYRDGESGDGVWHWQGDGEDHLESLTCPIVIRAQDLRHLVASEQQRAVVMPKGDEHEDHCASTAAIQFALELEDLEDIPAFLSMWNEGEFEEIRRAWPDCPDEVFIGADPLFKPAAPSQGESE